MYLLPFLLIFNNGKPGRPPTSEHQFSIDWVSHSFATPGNLSTHGCFILKPPESWVNSCNKYIVFPGSTWIPPLTPLFFCWCNWGLACWQRAFVWRFVGRLCGLSEFSGAAAGVGEKSAVFCWPLHGGDFRDFEWIATCHNTPHPCVRKKHTLLKMTWRVQYISMNWRVNWCKISSNSCMMEGTRWLEASLNQTVSYL